MAHEVFISYAEGDAAAAESVCALLEGDGLSCWIAPRDIGPGLVWAAAIVDAIERCRVMVVLVSSHATRSRQMARELELADSRHVPIVPFRIEDAPLSPDLEYFLGNRQWLDAHRGSLEDHADSLGQAVRGLLGGLRPSPHRVPPEDGGSRVPPGAPLRSRRSGRAIGEEASRVLSRGFAIVASGARALDAIDLGQPSTLLFALRFLLYTSGTAALFGLPAGWSLGVTRTAAYFAFLTLSEAIDFLAAGLRPARGDARPGGTGAPSGVRRRPLPVERLPPVDHALSVPGQDLPDRHAPAGG